MKNVEALRKKLQIEIDTEGLGPAQVRLIRSLNALLIHVLQTDEEAEFFDGSAELMRVCASLIQQSYFIDKTKKEETDIAYADQVLEFAVEVLSEHINLSQVVSYDN